MAVTVAVGLAEEVGRTGAFTKPDVVAAAVVDEEAVVLVVEVEMAIIDVVLVVEGRATCVVVETAGILEDMLTVLLFGGDAVTVGLTTMVVVAPSVPSICSISRMVSRSSLNGAHTANTTASIPR